MVIKIWETDSEWFDKLLIITKKNGTVIFITDFRELKK